MAFQEIAGRYVLLSTPVSVYAGRVSSVGEAGGMFPHHELRLVFDELEEFDDKGRSIVSGNFGGVRDLYVGRRWNEVYLLDGNRESVLDEVEKNGRLPEAVRKGLRRAYPLE